MYPALFKSLKTHLSIPRKLSIGHAGGEVRILVAGALAAPVFREELLSEWKTANHLARRFRENPLKQDDLLGAQLAERPLLEETTFVSDWETSGLDLALSKAKLNPMFQQHIHLFLHALVAFCILHRFDTNRRAPQRYFEHVRMLRYLLHATT